MTVTILVPVYGVERYIAECAESLFGQTYKDIEYVFCDDCTPDKSIDVLKEVVERYPERKEHVRIIRNEHNMGIGGTRAHLLSEVKSDCFCFADSDDILPENAIESLVRRMQETDADIVEGSYKELYKGTLSEAFMPLVGSDDAYFKKVLCQNIISLRLWGKLYKTEVLQRVPNLFFEGINFAEDVCATTRLVAVTTRAWTDEVVYYYRTDNVASYTKNISHKEIISYFRAMKEVLRFYHLRGHLPLCLEIGLLNVFRECRRSGISIQETENLLQYVPEHMTVRILKALFTWERFPILVSDYLYRLVRLLAVL